MANKKKISKELLEACERKDLSKVTELLLCGGDPCHVIKAKSTAAIHWVVFYDDDSTDILKAIISSDKITNINVGTIPNDISPLLRACYKGNIECAKILVENGADVTLKNKVGNGAVHYAALGGNPYMVEECLRWNGVDVNERGEKNKTALILGCQTGYMNVVRVLLSAGADVDLKDDYGYSAASYGKQKMGIPELIVKHQQILLERSTTLPSALGALSLSSNSPDNQNVALLEKVIKKSFPDFTEDKIKSVVTTIEQTGHDFNRENSQLLLLEPSDFDHVLKPLEIRVLLKAFKEEFSTAEHIEVMNF